MSYQVIARKWRPQAFEEVTGQEPITRTLRGAIEHDRLHHAYLFSGARGVGKTTTARLLAKALNCHKADRPTPTPCKSNDPTACASCREIAEGRSIDVLEIDAASNTGVDNVREAIINTVAVRPARDRFKVFIIDEVHMLSGAAFNALLKTLEEPPPRVVFIMATTESHKIPDTILSRSQQFEFRTIAAVKIVERLRLIADAEGVKVTDDALREIARAGEGSMRDAQSAFDQVISFSAGEIGAEDVETALGVAGAELRARVVRAVAEGRPADALAVVDDLVMRGHDLRNFCRDVLAHLRDLLVVKVAGEGAELADATEAERRELARAAGDFSESDLVRFFHSLTETERSLREGAHPRYQLEIGLIKLIEMRRLAPLGQILERLGALEEALRTGKAPAAASSPGGDAGGGATPRGGINPPPAAPRASAQRAEPLGAHGAPPTSLNAANAPRAFTPLQATPPAGPKRAAATPPPVNSVRSGADAGTAGSSPASAPLGVPPWEEPPVSPPPALRLVPAAEAASDATGATPEGGGAFQLAAVQAPPVIDLTPKAPVQKAPADAFVEQLKEGLEDKLKPLLAIALDGATKIAVEDEELRIEFPPELKHLRDNLSKPENLKLLREVAQGVAGRAVGVSVVVRDRREAAVPAPSDDAAALEQKRLREYAENHPAVQKLLRTFRAEIVDVRRVEPPAPAKPSLVRPAPQPRR